MIGPTDHKQPLSLKWKWGIVLFIIMSVVTTSILSVYTYQAISYQKNVAMQYSQEIFEKTKRYLERANYRYKAVEEFMEGDLKQEVDQNNILKLIHYFETENTSIKIFTLAGEPIYETDKYTIPNVPLSKDIRTYTIDDQIYMVRRDRLISPNTGIELGEIEIYIKPEYFVALKQAQLQEMLRTWLIAMAIILVISFLVSNYFLKPLTYLNNTLDIVEEESLDAIRMLQPSTNDEWSDLSLHINKLLDRIDLYVSNQRQFVEDASHELRTPVQIMEGHLNLLNRWGKDDPQVLEESIAASIQEIKRMKLLIQDMLDLSRADHVDVDYKDEVTEVISTTRQVFNNFQMIHPTFHFYLDVDNLSASRLYVKMFRNHFEQILIILLDNAVKYSGDHQEIHISMSESFGQVEIAIQDFGEGMSKEDRDKIFERFYRVDKARSRAKGGSGLGLSIAKQLINSYKGTIHVDSVLGQGSIFYIGFPILVDPKIIRKGLNTKYQQVTDSLSETSMKE